VADIRVGSGDDIDGLVWFAYTSGATGDANAGAQVGAFEEKKGREEEGEAMKASDLTPEEREGVIRMMKEHYPDFELRDDAEIDYYLFPFPKDREVMASDKAQAIWEAQAQQAASEWQAEPGGELLDFLSIVNRAFDRILSVPKIPSWR
jgi:hypothetical protein